MLAKLFLVAFFSVALARAGVTLRGSESVGNLIIQAGYTPEATLLQLTGAAKSKVTQTLEKIKNAPKEFKGEIKEHRNSLEQEYKTQMAALKETMHSAVKKAVEKNKPLSTLQCISNRTRETLRKLEDIEKRIEPDTEGLLQNALAGVSSFEIIMSGFTEYIEHLQKTKIEEIKKASNEYEKSQILKDVKQKLQIVENNLGNISKQVLASKFKFSGDFSLYDAKTTESLQKTQLAGSDLILKCVA